MSCQDYYDNIKKTFPEILKRHYGIVTYACREAGIHRDSYYRWRKENEAFAKECDIAYEEAGDYVENKLLKRIEDEDTTAIIFYCKTKLKNRGYLEKHEHEHYGNTNKDSIMQDVTHSIAESDQAIIDEYVARRKALEAPHG